MGRDTGRLWQEIKLIAGKDFFMAVMWENIKAFIVRHRLNVLKDVFLFIVITVLIHFVWRFWAVGFDYAPINKFMYSLMGLMAEEVYRESAWMIDVLLNIVRVDDSMQIYFPNNCMIYVNSGCSGLKQILQFSLLIFLFPGPRIKKLWFIPLGVIIVHLTNVVRVVGLAVVMNYWPKYWDFSHDYVFRPLFYIVIFILWVVWVERLKDKQPKSSI